MPNKAILRDRTLIVILCLTICAIIIILMQGRGDYALKPFAPLIKKREFSLSSVTEGLIIFRTKRSTQFNPCSVGSRVTMIVIILNINKDHLSDGERNLILSSMSYYASLPQSRIRIDQHKGYIYTLSEDLQNGKFIAIGTGNGLRNLTYTTHVKYILSCSVLSNNDSRIANLSVHAIEGALSDGHRHHVGQWFAIGGHLKDNTTLSSVTAQDGPLVTSSLSLNITNSTFRLKFTVPEKIFLPKDGISSNLALYLHNEDGSEMAKNTWISLRSRIISLYSSRAIYQSQPTGGYRMRLSAIDQDARQNDTTLTVQFIGPITPPNYITTLKLSSTTNILVTSYKDVDILFSLQSILAQYLEIPVDDIFSDFVDIKRSGTTSLLFDYKFSTRYLVGSSCNVSVIIKLRNKLIGSTAEQNLKQSLLPQFSVLPGLGEAFQQNCAHISTSAPSIKSGFGTKNVQTGRFFSFLISTTLFLPPKDSEMRLKLQLRFLNGTTVPSSYWISLDKEYLDEGVSIRGIASTQVASQELSYTFRLVATTPMLVEASLGITFNLVKISYSVSVTISFTHSSIITTPYTEFTQKFVFFISSYFSVSQDEVIFLSIGTTTHSTVQWSLSTLSATPCNFSELNLVKEKIFDSSGNVKSSLQTGMTNAVNWSPSAVEIKLSDSCNPPRVNITIPILYVPQYDALNYYVPESAFTGGGSKLELMLLDSVGNKLLTDSWVWFDNKTRKIAGFPTKESGPKSFRYILRAQSADGYSADQNITIYLGWSSPGYNLAYQITFSYQSLVLPKANIVNVFLQRLKGYFGRPSSQDIIILSTDLLSNFKGILLYQNTTLPTHVCDVTANNIIADKLSVNRYVSTPNAEFVSTLQPYITVTRVQVFTKGNCLVIKRKPPQFQLTNKEVLSFVKPIKTVPYCTVERYLVPENLFIDEEEGNTRNLRLSLRNNSGKALAIDNWVNVNSTSQMIYAVADDKTLISLSGPYIQYRLYAFDSDGKYDHAPLKFNISGIPPVVQYNVTMQLEVKGIMNDPYPVQLANIYEALGKVFGFDVSFHTRSYKVSSTPSKAEATFIWSPCNVNGQTCNLETIRLIRSKLFKPGTKAMNDQLNNYFQGTFFNVINLSESVGSNCQEDPPSVQLNLPNFYVGFCGTLLYKIPDNAFKDNQDGSTAKLKLKLLQSNGMVIPNGNWLQFDSKSQMILVTLTQAQSSSSFPKEHTFILVATDSSNLSVNTSIKVMLNETMPQFSHTFTVRATLGSSLNVQPSYLFSKKLQAYFGDEVNRNQIISSIEASGSRLIITWANCSLRNDPCDVLGISRIRSKLQTTTGVLQPEFVKAMQPEFTQLLLSEASTGSCLKDEPPKVSGSFGPISVSTCQTYREKVPEGTFSDKEQGGTRNLALSLQSNSYHWISFDTKAQELKILSTNDIAKGISSGSVKITLVANDLNSQQATHEVTVNLLRQAQTTTQKISMRYGIGASSAQMNFVELYDVMRKNITEYFKTAPDLLSAVEFDRLSATVTTSSELTADWSSCSFSRTSCDQSNINKLSTMVQNYHAFKTALKPHFNVTTIAFQLNGICKERSGPPVVKNPLPVINISYCGYTDYQIPSDTFYDPVDGNTRNLSLVLLNSTGQQPTETWIELDAKTQKFRIVIADNVIAQLPTPRIIEFKLKATAKRGLSVTDNVRIRLSEQPRNHSIQVKINFALWQKNPPSRNTILLTIAQRYASYLGGTSKDIQFVYIMQPPLGSFPYYVLRLANCSISHSPCDRNYIHAISSKLQDKYGTVPAFKSAMGSEVYLSYLQILEYGPCAARNSPPIVHIPLGKIQVHTCSTFNYTISSNTFRDEEDSSLSIDVTMVNGIPISGSYRWLFMRSSERLLYGIVTSYVIMNQPSSGYNVTIRATDGGGLFTESHLIIQIIGNKPQELYQFSLQLSAVSLGQQFFGEWEIITSLNRYFISRFTNIISYQIKSPSTVTVRCSICVLENKCDEVAASFYFMKISDAQNNATIELKKYFTNRYTIITAHVYRNKLCLQPQNPPVPSSPSWTITGSYCNGIRAVVPSTMFNDPEDGNARNLELSLYLGNKQIIPKAYWVQINRTSQVIYGRPTRAETLAYSSKTQITLVARDKTGLEGNTSIQFLFKSHEEPRYIYKLVYKPMKTYANLVDELQAFAVKLQAFLKDSSASVGFIQHSITNVDLHFFQYANCSVSYNPCDTASLNEVKDLLLTSNNLATNRFKSAMGGFMINYGEVQILSPCTKGNLHPPTITSRLTILNVSVCGMLSYRIPENTFYDTEDGNTRKLTLNLANAQNQPLSGNFWLQLNKSSQTIYGYATAATAFELTKTSLILTATDRTSLSASNSFTVKVIGPYQIIRDCQIQIEFSSSTQSGLSNIHLVQMISQSLQKYFSLTSSEIGLVDFQRRSSSQFTFSWSYCSASYANYRSTITELSHADYKRFITKVLMLLFESDHKTVKSRFSVAFNGLSVISVKTVFSGVCANLPPILVSKTDLSLNVNNCGYTSERIQPDWFYDFEDGNTYNLHLKFVDFSYQSVGIENWVNIDTVKWYLHASLRDAQRQTAASRFSFYIKATDSGGKIAYLPVYITKLTATSTKSPFSITFEYIIKNAGSKEVFVNESIALSEVTSRLYSLGSGKNIITHQYLAQYATEETRSFTWVPCAFEPCSTSSTLQKTKQLLDSNKGLFGSFKSAYLSEFNLQRAYYQSSCGVPSLPPATPDGSITINITMCSPLRYKLPPSTFVDSVDGEMPNLKVRLLDSKQAPVSISSWLQLNSATLELYGIFSSSMLTSTVASQSTSTSSSSSSSVPVSQVINFYLEATNSRGLKTKNQIKVNVLNYPYTSDCYTNITVRRTFGIANTLDLDVLYKLVNTISLYYNEQMVRIKVYKFAKLSSRTYSLIFSNCSFVHSSLKAAMWGLNESHRSSITAIFSRIIESNGTAKASFSKYLSANGFVLESVSASYSCIEDGPTSKVHSLRLYAFLCKTFEDPLANDLFTDKRDGSNLQLSLRYTNGQPVSPNEWVQLDTARRVIYGVVTFMVKMNIPSDYGYSYLIVAKDSSGRTANVSYTIKIANIAPLQHVRFMLGFQSIFNEYTRTADILLNLTRKLASYLNNDKNGRNVVFFSYDAINYVSFELCTFQCTPAMMTATLTKLQKQMFKSVPSDSFMTAMSPEITPRYIHVEGPKCIESTTITIVTNYSIEIDQQICGVIDYVIPKDVFSNSLGETTRDFLLTLKTASGKVIDYYSLIQFHQDLQTIRGVAVFSKLAKSLTFAISASSSRSTAPAVSTNLKINFPTYEAFKKLEKKLCTFTMVTTTNLNPAVSDVYILRALMKKIAWFFSISIQQLQVVSCKRSTSYPIVFTIEFSKCSWLYYLQSTTVVATYYQDIETVHKSVFRYEGTTIIGLKSSFIKAMKPDFNVVNVISNSTTCKPPPDIPPRKRNLDPVTIPPCGEFNYQIPANLFTDEDGNTRNLKVEVLQGDGKELALDSWIVFDNKTQTLSGLPLNITLVKQPQNGYSYRIKATDKLSQTTYAQLVIKIDGKPYKKYEDMGISFHYSSTISSKYQMTALLAFTRKASAYIGDPLNRFRVMESIVTPTGISMTLVNCTRCDAMAVLKFYTIYITKNAFNLYMAPEFPISFYLTVQGKCNPDSYRNVTSGITYNVTFCKRSTLDFLKLNGITQMPLDTKFIVRTETQQILPSNSWFWFNESSSSLEAFPSESLWKNQPMNGTYFATSTALVSTGERIGSFRKDALLIVGTAPTTGLQYNAKFTASLSTNSIDAYLISLVFKPLYAYLNREDLQVVSFKRERGSELKFELKFLICGLPSDCTNSSVKILNNKIFESPNKLRPDFLKIFSDQLKVSSMTDNCKDNPPIILHPDLNITVPICGIYRYKIPNTFANDIEDGDADNLLISLRMYDNTLLGRDSWIQFNETTHEIYAFPSESIIRSNPNKGWPYLIVVKDKGGKQVTTKLTVFLSPDEISFFKLAMSFQTVDIDRNTPYLDIQLRFLTMISSFYFDSPLSRYRILSFAKTENIGSKAEKFYIKFGNCSMSETICQKNDQQLKSSLTDLHRSYLNKNSRFYKYMSSSFVISSVQNESSYKVDNPPKVLNVINVIRLDTCGVYTSGIPSGTFYDEQQGTRLETVLTFENGTKPGSNYWIQYVNNKIYVASHGAVRSGTYRMKLTASDRCYQTTSTVVIIQFVQQKLESQYLLEMDAIVESVVPVAFYTSQLKVALKSLFSDSTYQVSITHYIKKDRQLKLQWENCSIVCNHTQINHVRNKIFLAYNIINPILLSKLNFNITNITEIYSKNCSKRTSDPPVANRSVVKMVPICSQINFTIPFDTFYDTDDGNTRNLHLALFTESKQPIGLQNWIQLDQNRQIIYGYPRLDEIGPIQRVHRYLLTATDKAGYSTTTPLTIEIIGDVPSVSYTISVTGVTTIGLDTPLISQEIMLINRIGSFFNDYAINNMAYSRSSESFQFKWSFCSMRKDPCDCFRIRSIRNRVIPLQNIQRTFGSEFTITSHVTDKMTGVCSHTQRPELRYDRNEIKIVTGQYFTYTIADNKFYDYEDGYTRNLTLLMSDGISYLDSSYWIKTQDYQICGLLTIDEAKRYQESRITSREYNTIAKDSCGKQTSDSYLVRITSIVTTFQYRITVVINGGFGANCTKMNSFIYKISSYINTPVSYIFVFNYTSDSLYPNSTSVSWGIRNITESNCNNRTVRTLREKFVTENGIRTTKFYDHMKPQFEVIQVTDEKSEACTNASIVPPPPKKDEDFPWWILILILILILFLLLLWLCWLCIPRCCANWCLKCCGSCCGKCCGRCCMPGGKYASLDNEQDVAGLPRSPEENKIGNTEKDGDDDEILRFPPPFLIPDDPKGNNFGFENDGEEEDYPSNPEDSPQNGSNFDNPGDDSSGFREELDDKLDYNVKPESMDSGVIEQELEQEQVQVAESVPTGPNNFIVPPLYSATRKDRRNSNQGDDFFADMLGEARGELSSEMSHQNYGFENEGSDIKNERNKDVENEMESDLLEKTERYENYSFDRTDSKFREDTKDDLISMEKMETVADSENVNTSYTAEKSEFRYDESEDLSQEQTLLNYPNLPATNASDNTTRLLPTPRILYVENQESHREGNVISETKSYNTETNRFSQFNVKLDEFSEATDMTQSLSLPSPDIITGKTMRSVELKLPRNTYEAFQAQRNEEFSSLGGEAVRRKTISVLVDGPFGNQVREVRLANMENLSNYNSKNVTASGPVSPTGSPGQVDFDDNMVRINSDSNEINFEQRDQINQQEDVYARSSIDGIPMDIEQRGSRNFETQYSNDRYIDGGFERERVFESYSNGPTSTVSQKSISREISIGQSQGDFNRDLYPNLPELRIAEYQNSLPVPPNQLNQKGSNQQRLLNNTEMSSLSQRSISRLGRRFSGNEDPMGVITSNGRRRSKSAERYMAQRNQEDSLDDWRYFDESANERFDSGSSSFPSNKNYRELLNDNTSNGYEMKTTRMSRTYVNEAHDNDSFV